MLDALDDVAEGLGLVDDSGLDEAARRQVARARAAGRAAARLAGGSAADVPPDLIALLYDLEDRWGGRAAARGTALAISVGIGVPRRLAVDRVALERALSVLLAQAVAVCRGGRVQIAVDGVDGGLRFTVEDDGPAEPERRAGDPALAAARDLAGTVGGDLELVFNDAGGMRAELSLPPSAVAPGAPGELDGIDLSGLRVLLAPLPQAEAETLAALVARFGGQADDWRAADGPGGHPPPVLVLDADAEDAPAALRWAKDGPATGVVAVTSSLLAGHREALWRAGATVVLSRPFPPADVVARTLHEVGTGAARQRTEAPVLDEARLTHLLALAGPDIAGELLDRMIEDLGSVEAGLAAAVPAHDVAQLRAQTHVLISLAGAVGADRLQQLAEELNAAAHAGDAGAIDRLGAETAPDLARLIAHVDEVRSSRRAQA